MSKMELWIMREFEENQNFLQSKVAVERAKWEKHWY